MNIIGITRAWAKHGRLTGQDEARKRLRARMHKVSAYDQTYEYMNARNKLNDETCGIYDSKLNLRDLECQTWKFNLLKQKSHTHPHNVCV
uniref:Uncharacterized protein n=1 Tax=Helianthus annuus TaxID=4232 RepID=A0A251SK39_HELAN